jgi:hypothetical protein
MRPLTGAPPTPDQLLSSPTEEALRSSTFLWRSGTDTRRIEITRLGGNLDHFYHFILDLVWPMYEWAQREGHVPPEAGLIALDLKDLHFAPAMQALLGVDMEAAPAVLPEATGAPVRLHGFNTKSGDHWNTFANAGDFREARLRFVDAVAARMGHEAKAAPAVVLIKRKEETGDRGASRRSIQDHEGLAEAVQTWCGAQGLAFHDVHLEDLDILRQFALFHGGPVLLIGQHGAGLVNGVWMNDSRSAVIELAGTDNPPHFTNLFNDLGMRYARLLCEGSGDHMAGQRITVDHRALLTALDALRSGVE